MHDSEHMIFHIKAVPVFRNAAITRILYCENPIPLHWYLILTRSDKLSLFNLLPSSIIHKNLSPYICSTSILFSFFGLPPQSLLPRRHPLPLPTPTTSHFSHQVQPNWRHINCSDSKGPSSKNNECHTKNRISEERLVSSNMDTLTEADCTGGQIWRGRTGPRPEEQAGRAGGLGKSRPEDGRAGRRT
jgi:hypothetical protein